MEKVTVLIPTYNHGSVITYQLESLLKQSSPPGKIVVLDDGSDDDTSEILESYQDSGSIEVLRQKKNSGIHAALDKLLDHVETEYFAFAAADDMLTTGWCEITASLLEKNKDAGMVVSNSYILEDKSVIATDTVASQMGEPEGLYSQSQFADLINRQGTLPPTNTIMYRSSVIEELIRPVLSRKDLGSLVDVLLILVIATKYPVAYSVKPTGLFVRDSASYGNAFFSEEQLASLLQKLEKFCKAGVPLIEPELVDFLMGFVKYTWAKKIILGDLHRQSWAFGNVRSRLACLAKLVVAFVRHERYKFLKLPGRGRAFGVHELSSQFNVSLIERMGVESLR